MKTDIDAIEKLANKFGAKISDLTKKLEEKKRKEEKNRGAEELTQFLSLMNISNILSQGQNFDVDNMYQARKSKGFPPIPANAPMWIHVMMAAIDEPDPIERRAKYKTFFHGLNALNKDPVRKQQAEEEFRIDQEEEKNQFIDQARRGWLKFKNFKKWRRQYPVLFMNYPSEEDLIQGAQKYLVKRNKIQVKKERLASIVRQSPNQLPIGTILYYTQFANLTNRQWIKKVGPNQWETDDEYGPNDKYVSDLISSVNDEGEWAKLLFKPEVYFANKITSYLPSKAEIIAIIDEYLKLKPENFFSPGTWEFDISEYEDEE